jgi:hypothetical protein
MLQVPWSVYSRVNIGDAQEAIIRTPMVCTPVQGYENLGRNMAELKRFIEQATVVFKYYEDTLIKEDKSGDKAANGR